MNFPTGGYEFPHSSSHLCIHQVGLGLYVANMFKAMKSASMQQEANFVKAGHPGLFPSAPKVTHDDWDRIHPSLVCPTKYLQSEIQARRKRGRPGARKGDRSDGESELESRERVDGPSTSMEEVSPLLHSYNVYVPEWSGLQGRFAMETVESEDDDFAPELSQRTGSQKQASQQVCKEYCC